MNKATLIKQLQKKYPKMSIMADGNGWVSDSPESFSISAEEPLMDSRGYDMFNYWTQDYTYYDLGVSIELCQWLEKNGWHTEWVNPGVVGVFKD
jgi:hypothetical protein